MNISSLINNNLGSQNQMSYSPTLVKSDEDYYTSFSSATKKVDSDPDNNNPMLNMTMIPYGNTNMSYGMVSRYSTESTKDNPIIRVTSNYGGETNSYEIKVKDINPNSASGIEMFALSSYYDSIGKGSEFTFGTFCYLKNINTGSEISNGTDSYDDFMNAKYNWTQMCSKAMDNDLNSGYFEQYKKDQYLLNLFKNTEKEHV